jgi:thiopeptide-type bacteriocin biosynthesis protein
LLENKIEKNEKRERTELSLIKYMIRMCTRCTPYGLFASCSVGKFDESVNVHLSATENLCRYGRLDMDYVCELHADLLKQKEISSQLLFFPNTSLYHLGDQWRYIEHRFAKETGRSYHLVEIDRSSYLDKILKKSENGLRPGELATSITDEEISPGEALDFIYELIQSQVLVDELQPTVTGEEYFSLLLGKLKTLQYTEKYLEPLEKITEFFSQLKNGDNEEKNRLYPQIVKELRQTEVPLHLKTLIQVDSYRPVTTCLLNKRINDEILKGFTLLDLLTPDHSTRDPFSDFKTAFINRYEGEFMPLAEVLDTESGIGYGKFATNGMEESPLIDNLTIGKETAASSSFQEAENFKWQLYQQAISENRTEVLIDDKVIERLSKKEFGIAGLPDSIYTMVKINAASANDIDNGNYRISMQPPSGPSGGNLLGRFCHLDSEIGKLTSSILEEEEAHRPECIYAEVVHLPESRIGNILMRPLLRKYEIPYLCGTTLKKEFQIPVNDLLVGIENNKVILRSKKLDKEIFPRLTTAHNFHMTTLPVYQFLCDLQFQEIRQIGWHWGVLGDRPFLPRVTYGRFILSRAKWIMTKEDTKDCDKKADDQLLKQFAEKRNHLNLPEYALLSQGDNELLLHLRNIFCIKLLLAEINKTGSVVLTETTDTLDQCWIKSNQGRHPGEFIFAFTKKKEALQKLPANFSQQQNKAPVRRTFSVGSEWLYAKIYCGAKTGEKLLCSVLKPFADTLVSEKIIDKFFFLRFHDTSHHIRIRFHNSIKKDFWKELILRLENILQPSFENRTVHNLQFETYRREVERYGADTMNLSEDVFCHHSVAVLNFISLLEGDEGEQYRWQIGLKAIDLMLDHFNYTLEQKRNLIRSLDANFSEEFKIGSIERKKISERFSDHKQLVNIVMGDAWQEDETLVKAINVFKNQSPCYQKTIKEI